MTSSPSGSAVERLGRLEPDGRREAGEVARADVGQVRADQVEPDRSAEHPRRGPRPRHKVGNRDPDAVGHAMRDRVLPGERSRVGRSVGRDDLDLARHPEAAQRGGDRHGDRAAAGSDIGEADGRRAGGSRSATEHIGDLREREVHQELGLRPRHERAGVGRQRQAVELLNAADVGHGLAGGAPLEGQCEARRRAVPRGGAGMGQHPSAIRAERVGQQQLGVQPGARRTGRPEAVGARAQELADGCHRAAGQDRGSLSSASEASRSAWSVVLSASSSRSRLPSRTPGRFDRSIPIRWSVTRSWG
jgi:hypothetical protein